MLLLSYINYVKKFEGHKPGREKRLENDPTIFRYRISFLMLIYTFYEILVFYVFYNVIFQSQNSRKKFGFPLFEPVLFYFVILCFYFICLFHLYV